MIFECFQVHFLKDIIILKRVLNLLVLNELKPESVLLQNKSHVRDGLAEEVVLLCQRYGRHCLWR